MIKYLYLIFIILLITNVSSLIAGRENVVTTIPKCSHLFVNVTATQEIHNEEYDFPYCLKLEEDHYWFCECSDNYDLIISLHLRAMNNYTFLIESFYEPDLSARRRSSSGACRTDWSCTEWSACVEGSQFRECFYPLGWCEPVHDKPEEVRECEAEELIVPEPSTEIPIIDEPDTKLNISHEIIQIPVDDGVDDGVDDEEADKTNYLRIILILSMLLVFTLILLSLQRRNKKE